MFSTTITNSFDISLSFIEDLEKGISNPNSWIKQQHHPHCVVVQSDDYYYKIYENSIELGSFYSLIRRKLAEIYEKVYGINWKIFETVRNDKIYQIQQRSKLVECTEKDLSFEDLLLSWRKTQLLLEKSLGFSYILDQISENYISNGNTKPFKLKIMREAINKYEDYAFAPSGEVLLLDDDDWYIAVVDENGENIPGKNIAIPVDTEIGQMTFQAMRSAFYANEGAKLEDLDEMMSKWMIFDQKDEKVDSGKSMYDKKEQMLHDNLKLLTTGEKSFLTKPLLFVKQDTKFKEIC